MTPAPLPGSADGPTPTDPPAAHPSAGPPAVELHVHVEGTLEPELILQLAERNRVELPDTDLDELRARYAFTDLQSFLDLYYANMAVLRAPEDFAAMTAAYLDRAARAGVRHVELFVDPQAHLARGVPLADLLDGVTGALAAAPQGMTTGLVPCFLRDRPVPEALEVLEGLLGSGVELLGIGLDSAEVGHPPGEFAEVYARARAAGLRLVAHAGEEGPADYVREALDVLGVERIDHGIRSLDDPALVQRLAEEAVPLTVCPLSNVRLRTVDVLADHPLPRMLEAGLAVSVHSDDPAYFGGYVDDVHRAVRATLDLTPAQVRTLAENAVEAAFVDDARRAELRGEVSAWAAGG